MLNNRYFLKSNKHGEKYLDVYETFVYRSVSLNQCFVFSMKKEGNKNMSINVDRVTLQLPKCA